MPEPIAAPFWQVLTRLGEAQIVLPVLIVSMGWLLRQPGNAGLVTRWCGFIAGAALVTLATKVAFIGFGVGVAAIDFTGVSGHAMFAALAYPLLACVLSAGLPALQRRGALATGIGLALAVGLSRVMLHAHSPSEVIAGLAVGGAASAAALRLSRHPISTVPLWLPLGVALWLGITPVGAPVSNTHGLVTRLSLALSGRAVPYTRSDLRRKRPLSAQACCQSVRRGGSRLETAHLHTTPRGEANRRNEFIWSVHGRPQWIDNLHIRNSPTTALTFAQPKPDLAAAQRAIAYGGVIEWENMLWAGACSRVVPTSRGRRASATVGTTPWRPTWTPCRLRNRSARRSAAWRCAR